jgi:hypothetical protein
MVLLPSAFFDLEMHMGHGPGTSGNQWLTIWVHGEGKPRDGIEYEYEYRVAEYEYDPTVRIAPNRRGNMSLTRTHAGLPKVRT